MTLSPSTLDAMLLDAMALHRAGRAADAVRGYEAIMSRIGNPMKLGYLRALALLETGGAAAALPFLDAAVAAAPGQAFLHSVWALARIMLAQGAEAAVGFGQMMALRGEPPGDTAALRDAMAMWHRRIDHCRRFHPLVAALGPVMASGYEFQPVDGVCPVCRGRRVHRLFSLTAAQAAQHFQRMELDPEAFEGLRARIAALWGGSGCSVLRCAACGFGFADPFAAGDAGFYNAAFPVTDYPDGKWEFTETRDALLARHGAPGDGGPAILEIGAGKGAFLSTVVPAVTRPERITFTEYAADRIAALGALGYRFMDPDAVRRPSPDGRECFDAVCAFQVVEHCDGLDELFSGFDAVLRPGGSVFLAVPNPDFTAFTECNGGLIDMPPNHIGRWTPAALDIMGRRQGWSMAACRIDPTESAAQKRHSFHTFRFMREAQMPGRLAHTIDLCPEPRLRAHLMSQMALLYETLFDPVAGVLDSPASGTSLWVHFVKPRRG